MMLRRRTPGLAGPVMVVMVLLGGCDDSDRDAQTTSTTAVETTTTEAVTTFAPATTSAPATSGSDPTTTSQVGEPPAIDLAGPTTVLTRDGIVPISGWLDRPGEVTVDGSPVDVLDDPAGIWTFETVLELGPGSHSIPISVTGADGAEKEIFLGVLVDPEFETRLAMVVDVDLVARTLVVDDVELLTGHEATTAAREDGVIGPDEEVPGDFYLRNPDTTPETLTLGDPRFVTLQACLPEPGPCVVGQPAELEIWVDLREEPRRAEELFGWSWYGGGRSPFELTLLDGVVVQMIEQYLP